MAETAAMLTDEVLPYEPLRQWVLSLPHALRVLGVAFRTISGYLIRKAAGDHFPGSGACDRDPSAPIWGSP